MDEIVNLILNSSVSIIVIAFFMYRDLKFTARLENTLTCLVDTVETLKDIVSKKNKEE